jgi:type I restriction enzyme S subunit
VFQFLRSASGQREILKDFRGATVGGIGRGFVDLARVPLPPLREQRRIAAILDEADALRAKHNGTLSLRGELQVSVFHSHFTDQRSAALTVSDVLTDAPNAIRTGPFGSDLLHGEFVGHGIPVLGIDNVVKNAFAWAKPRFITEEKYESLRRYTVRPGDVLISIMGTVGRCGIAPENIGTAINTKHLCCITLDQSRCLPEYLHAYFLHHPTAREYRRKTSKGAVMDGLNLGIIKSLPLVLPPLDEQREYVTTLASIEAISDKLKSQGFDNLFASLQHRAFRGEL